jgi:hypothetical protein
LEQPGYLSSGPVRNPYAFFSPLGQTVNPTPGAFSFLVRPHNTAALYAIFVIIGIGSIMLLPVGIELGVELTRNPDGSSALLWFLYVPPPPRALLFSFAAPTDLFFCILPLVEICCVSSLSYVSHLPSDVVTTPPTDLLQIISTKRSSRLGRGKPAIEHASRDLIQRHLCFHRLSARIFPRRQASTTRNGRTDE